MWASEAKKVEACATHHGVRIWYGPATAAIQTQSPATSAALTTGVRSKTPATSEKRFRFAAYFCVTSNAAATTGLAH